MTDDPYLSALGRVAQELAEADAVSAELREKRLNLMWEARRTGASYAMIAEAAGVTKAYVHQVVKLEIQRQKAEFDANSHTSKSETQKFEQAVKEILDGET